MSQPQPLSDNRRGPVRRLPIFLALALAAAGLQADEVVGRITAIDQAAHRIQIDGTWFELEPATLVRKEQQGGTAIPVLPQSLQPGQAISAEMKKDHIGRLRILSHDIDSRPTLVAPPLKRRK